jgi:hypothetical protein
MERPDLNECEWTRIPSAIVDEQDRRALCAILSAAGLEVRVVRIKRTKNATPQRYVEYRETGSFNAKTEE